MTPVPIGMICGGPDVGRDACLDVGAMIGTHTCVVANTGAGKTGLLRVIQEQTRPLIQQIIIDPEGESASLRTATAEYLIAGGDNGDVPATLANAVGLAKALMANAGISAILQLDHLKPWEQQEFVGAFLEQLMHTPAAQRHPFLLCLDEAQRWAPQEGNVASSAAMHDVAARGRKRGISAVFATQRMAGIDKNVTGGVNNWFLGRVAQDADRRAAALALGMSASSPEAKEIAFMPKRTFWAFGPAIAERPIQFGVYEAKTPMQKAGAAPVPVAPTPKALQKLVEALSKAAAPETPAVPVPAAPGAPSVDLEAIRKEAHDVGVGIGYDAGLVQGTGHILDHLETFIAEQRAAFLGDVAVGVDDRDAATAPIEPVSVQDYGDSAALEEHRARIRDGAQALIDRETAYKAAKKPAAPSVNGKRPAAYKVLDTLLWWEKMGHASVTRQRATVMAGYSPKASTFGVYVSQLTKDDLISIPKPGMLQLTAAGRALANDPGRLNLIQSAGALLSPAERKVFDALVQTRSPLDRGDLADLLQLSRNASTLGVYISKLSSFGFVEIPEKGKVALATWLRA